MALSSNFMNSNYGILSNATVPSLSNLVGSLAFAQDASGNIYSGTSGRSIIKITSSYVQTTVTSNLPARLVGIAYTGGYLYASTAGNYTILKYNLTGSLVQTIGSTAGYADGDASTAKFNSAFNNLFKLTADESGNVYATDSGNKLIRKIDPSGNVTTVAGIRNSTTIVDGIGSAASFNTLLNIQYNNNILYVIDSYDVTYSYTIIRTISLPSYTVRTTSNRVAPINSALTIDTNGNIYTNDMLGQFVQINTRPVCTAFHQLSIAYNGSIYVAAGYDGVDYSAAIATSTDGFSWIRAPGDPFAGAYPGSGSGVAWNGSYFLAVGTNSNSSKTIAKSLDGSNWTVSTNNPFAGRGGAGVAWNGTYWVAVGGNSNASITVASSTDGLNWTPSTTNPFAGGGGGGVTWAGSFWVAVGGSSSGNTIFKSTDAMTWTPSVNNPFTGGLGKCVAWNGSYLLAGGYDGVRNGPTCIAKSTDGINWTGFPNNVFYAGTGGAELYAFAWNGTYWVAVGSKQFGNIAGSIGISTNGENWTEAPSTINKYTRFASVIWNSNTSTWYVGCQGGVGAQGGSVYGGGILASKDGLNWSISPTYALTPGAQVSTAIFNTSTTNINYINLNTSNYGVLSWVDRTPIVSGGVVGSAGGSPTTVQFASATANPVANGLIFSNKDASGNTFVIDGQRIRKMDLSGNYTEVAGVYNTTGNTNGPGASALFNNPGGIAIDRSGNIYVADTGNYVIRKIDTSYNVTTVVGTQGVSGVINAAGTSARFRSPQKMVTDGSIALYVVDVGAGAGSTNIIRKVSLSTYSVTSFALYSVGILLAIDLIGNLYTNGSIIQIDSAGQATVFALTSGSPTSIATDASGNVYYGTYDSTASTSSVTVLNSAGLVIAAYGPIAGSTGNISVNPSTGAVSLFSPGTVTLTTIPIGVFTVINTRPPCFLEGTRIRCFVDDIEQYLPIESLKPGMLVQTIANGYMAIDTIGHSKIYNPGNDARSKNRLYTCYRADYTGMNADLYMTGCHSILVDKLTEEEEKNVLEDYGKLYTTDRKYRLPTYLDVRAKPWNSEGLYTIWHLALENTDYYANYGIYANGLVVETTSKRYLKELSGMTLV